MENPGPAQKPTLMFLSASSPSGTPAARSFVPSILALAAGIIWSRFATIPTTLCLILIMVLAVRLLLAGRLHNRRLNSLMLLALFFLTGGVHASLEMAPPESPDHIYHLLSRHREASLIGTLVRSPETRNGKTRLLMDLKKLLNKQEIVNARGLVRLALPGPPPAGLKPGDLFIARARLSPISSYGVPGTFDYKRYLANQSIWVSGWVRSPMLLMKINTTAEKSLKEKISSLPEIIRHRIALFVSSSLPPEQAGVYKAILIGDRSGLPDEIMEDFKVSGCMHLLAISGMHMGLLAFTLSFLIGWLLRRSQWAILNLSVRKTAIFLSLPPLIAYALIAGFHTPVMRALIMVSVFIFAILVDRQWSVANNIAIAAFIILAMKPGLLFTASFQLSFAAVSTIALFSPTLAALIKHQPGSATSHWQHIRQWALFSIMISTIATAGTAPVLAYHFNRVSLLSPVSTLLIEPFLCLWSLLLGLSATLLIPVPLIADFLIHTGSFGITASISIASAPSGLPTTT